MDSIKTKHLRHGYRLVGWVGRLAGWVGPCGQHQDGTPEAWLQAGRVGRSLWTGIKTEHLRDGYRLAGWVGWQGG